MCPRKWQRIGALSDRTQPLVWNMSGPVCLPWTAYGDNKGLAHESIESWNVFINALLEDKPDLATIENSDRMPINVLTDEIYEAKKSNDFFVVPLILDTTSRASVLTSFLSGLKFEGGARREEENGHEEEEEEEEQHQQRGGEEGARRREEARRKRTWRTRVNQDAMIWLGPRSPADIQKQFDALFRVSKEMAADGLM
eukprot:6044724-Pyramimonas_sp.AAC.1